MENKLIDDEIEIREINDLKALYYKIKYPEQKINDDPIFKKWISSLKEKNGLITYCNKCNLFFHLSNEKKVKEIKCKSCNSYCGYICKYCGKIYFGCSYCCLKTGIINSFKFNLFDGKNNCKEDWTVILKFIPFTFFIISYFNITISIFLGKRMKIKENDFSCYIDKENFSSYFTLIISFLLSILYSLIFLFNI